MGKPESIDALAKRLRARNQRLDALVNKPAFIEDPRVRFGTSMCSVRCC